MVQVNGLTEYKEEVKIIYFGSVLESRIAEIKLADVNQGLYTDRSAKACPFKLPTYSRLISEDFITFRDKFTKAAEDNRITRRDKVDKLLEVLTSKAMANLPLLGIRDIDQAWGYIETAYGNPHSSLDFRLTKIKSIPGLADRVEEGDAQQAADWYLDYETAVSSILMLGNRDPELQAVA